MTFSPQSSRITDMRSVLSLSKPTSFRTPAPSPQALCVSRLNINLSQIMCSNIQLGTWIPYSPRPGRRQYIPIDQLQLSRECPVGCFAWGLAYCFNMEILHISGESFRLISKSIHFPSPGDPLGKNSVKSSPVKHDRVFHRRVNSILFDLFILWSTTYPLALCMIKLNLICLGHFWVLKALEPRSHPWSDWFNLQPAVPNNFIIGLWGNIGKIWSRERRVCFKKTMRSSRLGL
jgi:hypothetical protein